MNKQPVRMFETKADDEVDLFGLALDLWNQRWLIFSFAVAAVVAAMVYLSVVTYTYTAELRVIPAQASGISSDKLGGLAGLASIAGVDLPQDPGSQSFRLYTESLRSRSVAESLAGRSDLMRVLFRDEWDEKTNRYEKPQSGYLAYVLGGVKSLLGLPKTVWHEPGPARLGDYIVSNVKILKDTSPVVTLTFENENPWFAVEFLSALHAALDESIRQKALNRANIYIDYLADQLSRVSLAEHRSALAGMLSEQERIKMMASTSAPYAADLLGPVTVSLQPTKPRPAMVVVISLAGGIGLGILVALLRTRIRRYRDERKIAPDG